MVATAVAATTPRSDATANEKKSTTPRTGEAKKKLRHAAASKPINSTLAVAGSTNNFGSASPFGSSVSRCSPSGTFAHHLPNHKPQSHAVSAVSHLPRHRMPNRKWQPAGLGDEQPAALADLAGTPVSDRLAAAAVDVSDPTASDDGQSSTRGRGGGGSDASSIVSAASAARAARSAAKPSTPRNAGEEQRRSRALRAEITAMREQKLAAITEADARGAGGGGAHLQRRRPGTAPPTNALSVPLGAIGSLSRCDHVRVDRGAENVSNRRPGEISLEYADLLHFVNGEARRR